MLGCSYRFFKCALQCHTSAISFLLPGYITSPTYAQASNMQLFDSVTDITHKSMDMLYKSTLGVKVDSLLSKNQALKVKLL